MYYQANDFIQGLQDGDHMEVNQNPNNHAYTFQIYTAIKGYVNTQQFDSDPTLPISATNHASIGEGHMKIYYDANNNLLWDFAFVRNATTANAGMHCGGPLDPYVYIDYKRYNQDACSNQYSRYNNDFTCDLSASSQPVDLGDYTQAPWRNPTSGNTQITLYAPEALGTATLTVVMSIDIQGGTTYSSPEYEYYMDLYTYS